MAEATEPSVLVERDGGTLVITLNKPHIRNSMDAAMAHAVAAALDQLDSDPALVVGILTGAGGTFSAGMDLKAFLRTGERPEVEGRGLAGLTASPPRTPLIAAVEGHAVAGGCELVLACDLVVAADDAVFGLPEVKRGLIAGSGGLVRLHRLIPPRLAMEHALTGRPLPATEAHRWGLVNQLVPRGGALAAARELAAEIAENGPLAVRATKQVLVESASWPADEVWQRQEQVLQSVVRSADAQEGAAAFVEKRSPVWRGV